MKNLKLINDYIYSYYENLFFYNKCDAIFYKIIKETKKNTYLKDNFGPCSHYIFDKLIKFYQKRQDVYIIMDYRYNLSKPYAIYSNYQYISISPFYFDYDLDKIYYNKSDDRISNLIKLRESIYKY